MKQDIIKKKPDNNKNTPGNILRFKNPQNTGIMGGIERSTNLYHKHLILPIIEIQQSPYITLYISTLRNPQGPKLENEHKNLNFSHSCKFEGKQNHGLIYPEETIELSIHMQIQTCDYSISYTCNVLFIRLMEILVICFKS